MWGPPVGLALAALVLALFTNHLADAVAISLLSMGLVTITTLLAAATTKWARRAERSPSPAVTVPPLESQEDESVQDIELWEGVIIHAEEQSFVARLSPLSQDLPEEEAWFEIAELGIDQRKFVRLGALFEWRAGLTEERDGMLVGLSSLRFMSGPAPTDQDRMAAQELADRIERSFSGQLSP